MADNIPQYDASPQNIPRPNPIGYEAEIQAGRRESQLAHEIGEEVSQGFNHLGSGVSSVLEARDQAMTHHEQTSNLPQIGQLEGARGLSIQNVINSGPPGQTVQAGLAALQQQRQASYDKFLDNFSSVGGKRWAQEEVAHMQEQDAKEFGTAFITNQASSAVHGFQSAINSMSTAAYNDPSSALHSIETLDRLHSTVLGPYDTPENHAAMEKANIQGKSALAKAAIQGIIDKNPSVGMKALDAGGLSQYLTEQDQSALRNHAQEMNRAAISQAYLSHMESRAQIDDANDASMRGILGQVKYNPETQTNEFPSSMTTDIQKAASLPPGSPGSIKGSTAAELLGAVERGMKTTQEAQQKNLYDDLRGKLLLPPDDPQRLTVTDITKALLSHEITGEQGNALNQSLTSMPQEEKDRINELKTNMTTILNSGNDAQGAAKLQAAEDAMWGRLQLAQVQGVPWQDALNSNSPNYIFKNADPKATPFSEFDTVAGKVSLNTPANQFQAQARDSVGLAIQVANLSRTASPEQIKAMTGIDISQGNWCARLVNYALEDVGIEGTGSAMAKSFLGWGAPVAPSEVQAGDVFYSDQGHAHVGLATGATRVAQGQLQIQVVSSHLQGDASNPGGVEWRNAQMLQLRRSNASLAQISQNPQAAWKLPWSTEWQHGDE